MSRHVIETLNIKIIAPNNYEFITVIENENINNDTDWQSIIKSYDLI